MESVVLGIIFLVAIVMAVLIALVAVAAVVIGVVALARRSRDARPRSSPLAPDRPGPSPEPALRRHAGPVRRTSVPAQPSIA
ncbi:hypothetical protein [Brachybacterium massiliense]|uniref:hypothetical protein n=1 Tax=Brachybacterium massiliense TaxID=1755098 RepID=UPI000B3BB5F1|nr:hypothetical protein [Brachybacterium massiliense]